MMSFDQVTIKYELVGTGWARCKISAGAEEATITASYLSDALGDLLMAVTLIVEGAERSQAEFWEEPGEYRWIFRRSSSDVEVEILWFDELWSFQPDELGEAIIKFRCAPRRLGQSLVLALEDIANAYSIEGYRKKWIEHDYPTIALEWLRSALK